MNGVIQKELVFQATRIFNYQLKKVTLEIQWKTAFIFITIHRKNKRRNLIEKCRSPAELIVFHSVIEALQLQKKKNIYSHVKVGNIGLPP